jgi:hypothetical protein
LLHFDVIGLETFAFLTPSSRYSTEEIITLWHCGVRVGWYFRERKDPEVHYMGMLAGCISASEGAAS